MVENLTQTHISITLKKKDVWKCSFSYDLKHADNVDDNGCQKIKLDIFNCVIVFFFTFCKRDKETENCIADIYVFVLHKNEPTVLVVA